METMTVVHKICIPAGTPPIPLPTGLDDLLGGSNSTLLSREKALSKAFGGGGETCLPSDEVILAWCLECIRVRRGMGEILEPEALRYWVRYTYNSHTPEFKAVGERISALLEG